MTTELEEQFFKVFGIKPIFRYFVQSELPIVGTDHCRPTYDLTKEQFKNFALSRAKGYKIAEVVKLYPEITDRVLLNLIFCLIKYEESFEEMQGETIEEFKNYILFKCIGIKTTGDKWLEQQIQQLFKERK